MFVHKKAYDYYVIGFCYINGSRYDSQFKAMLLEREPQVVHCLTEKMLAYATGRLLEAGDRGEVDQIVSTERRRKPTTRSGPLDRPERALLEKIDPLI